MEEVVEMEALKIVGDGKSQSKYCERVFSDFPQDIVSTSQYQVCVPASDLANWWPDEPEHGRMEELERSHAWRVCSKGCRGESAKPRVRAVSRSTHRSSCGVLELARTCVQMAVRWLQKDEIRDAQRRCSFFSTSVSWFSLLPMQQTSITTSSTSPLF